MAQKKGVGGSPEQRQRWGRRRKESRLQAGGRERGKRRSFPALPAAGCAALDLVRLLPLGKRPGRLRGAESQRAMGSPVLWSALLLTPLLLLLLRFPSSRGFPGRASEAASSAKHRGPSARDTGRCRGRPLFAPNLSFTAQGRGRRRVGLTFGHREGRAGCQLLAGCRASRLGKPEYPLRLGFQGSRHTHVGAGGYSEKFGRGLFSHQPEFCLSWLFRARAQVPGGLSWKDTPLPLTRGPRPPLRLQGTSHGGATLADSRSRASPAFPNPPTGDSEKVCASGRKVPAESGDMWHALG